MSKESLKVGDKVLFRENSLYENGPNSGDIGRIIEIKDNSKYPYLIQLNKNNFKWQLDESSFNLIHESEKKKLGTKFDNEKPQIDLIPYEAIEEIAKVLTFGATKYNVANWADGIEMRRLLSATFRHLGKFNAGEDMDDESLTLHLGNAAANLCFAIWMYKNRPDLDNRWIKGVKK